MIALDAVLRRLTALTHISRGNGGGLLTRVGLHLRVAAGGNWTQCLGRMCRAQAARRAGVGLSAERALATELRQSLRFSRLSSAPVATTGDERVVGTADEDGAAMTQHVEGLVVDRPPDVLSMPRAAT
jgi:hypothetical protein